jgi:hypothetical protein
VTAAIHSDPADRYPPTSTRDPVFGNPAQDRTAPFGSNRGSLPMPCLPLEGIRPGSEDMLPRGGRAHSETRNGPAGATNARGMRALRGR